MREEKVKLAKEVVNSAGEKVTEVTITEPTGRDLEDFGNPIKSIDSEGNASIDFAVGAQYVERCANVPIDAIRAQPASVLNNCVKVILDFLVNP